MWFRNPLLTQLAADAYSTFTVDDDTHKKVINSDIRKDISWVRCNLSHLQVLVKLQQIPVANGIVKRGNNE